ncbi:MAG TPA: NAD(P)H-dependent oxidoreductase subunit E [Syntrophorhabdus sp.]|jgi:NADH:ubiquinone oxidoreductase subunit E|nr:NAD(P)H-dependent oxidoreductase subunit E [Syntrophorhabdus sp.]MDI9559226.1 NAD(P)H-dependent oxidoreductase subunit E [Pseudomonadota bacterium]OPX95814.1 MAG: NADP-reducing hydrogenase subunit HndA [Syntrophorhabdus sp. PtaB.Bin027]OQB74137.1 MAG: NADP-reducing hydrogenase subunit HndA [Deltaproteobacteria bacterium ADurb.Bin135]MBP8744621.1 NAD(P)H-dependent oxidoreductase subunit E [Syntrophorhabdus sp.]
MATDNNQSSAEMQEAKLYPRLDEIIAEHSGRPEDLIMVLHKAQGLFGYLPRKVQEKVAEGLNISLSEVYGVITFYNFFSTVPQGRHSVKICLGTACYVRGSQQVLDKAQKDLGIKVGGTTEDRRYSLDVVRCIGACGLAPAMLIDDDVYGRVKSTNLANILEKYE